VGGGSDILPWLAGIVVMLGVLLAGQMQVAVNPLGRRARRIAGQSARVPPRQRQALARRAIARIHELLQRFGLEDGPARRAFEGQLARAGIRQGEAVVVLQVATLVAPTIGGLLGWLLSPLLIEAPDLPARLLTAALGVVAGTVAPRLWLRNAIGRRETAIRASLPLALDLNVICVEAGLALDGALNRLGRELAPVAPQIADEIALTAIELGFLPDRAEAFRNLTNRVQIEEIRALVAMFQQTERYGTPLAQALRTLADSVREAALLRIEERAARLPALLTVPLILFVLPPLFIILIGPAILQLMASG
jgi:tight adherence protein C